MHGHGPPISVVYSGVDARFFDPVAASVGTEVLATHGLDRRRYFLHPGAIDPRKNTRLVLESFERYRARGGDAELVVVGLADAEQRQFRRWIGAAAKHVHLLSFVADQIMLVLLQSARALVYVPSEEGFGYPLVEAMASRTPAIVSSIDVLGELSAGTALPVPVGQIDSLAQMMRKVDLATENQLADLALRGSERAAQFSVSQMGANTAQVYRDAIDRRGRRQT